MPRREICLKPLLPLCDLFSLLSSSSLFQLLYNKHLCVPGGCLRISESLQLSATQVVVKADSYDLVLWVWNRTCEHYAWQDRGVQRMTHGVCLGYSTMNAKAYSLVSKEGSRTWYSPSVRSTGSSNINLLELQREEAGAHNLKEAPVGWLRKGVFILSSVVAETQMRTRVF